MEVTEPAKEEAGAERWAGEGQRSEPRWLAGSLSCEGQGSERERREHGRRAGSETPVPVGIM